MGNDVSALGNVGDLSEQFDPLTDWTAHSGVGVITTLPMSDEEKAAARPRLIGFVLPKEEASGH